jgi:hypothetical protein
MRALQGEARHRVVIKFTLFPISAVVAFRAVSAVCALMLIIAGVAAVTGFGRMRSGISSTVTPCTRRRAMFPNQRKICVAVMIERRRLPAGWRVTGGTIRAPRSFVNIIFCMASIACPWWLANAVACAVTSGARCLTMPTDQRKTGIAIMIKGRSGPAFGGVAGRTIRPPGSPMHIILCMTADAGTGRSCPALSRVTGQTSKRAVFTHQAKACLCMVERQLTLPIRRCVAGLARPAETTKMRIFFRMTTCASLRRTAKVLVPAVASKAPRARMSAGKRIVGQIVIKGGGVELNQLETATMVITMTRLTLRSAR